MSSTNTYTSFAVVGAGTVGKLVVNALAAKPSSSVTILSRSDKSDPAHPKNVKVVAVDYDNHAAVVAALKANNVQVVIDTTTVHGKEFHVKLADASKEAGVGLFVPSEWGIVAASGPIAWKAEVRSHLEAIKLPYALIFTSLFTEYIPWVSHAESGKFHILGKGDTPVSITSVQDGADFLAHILTTLPPSKLANTSYRLQGDRGTLKQFAARFKLPVELHTDKLPLDGPAADFVNVLAKFIDEGKGSSGWDIEKGVDVEELAGSGNKFWEGHHWKTIEEVHKK